MLGRLWWHCRSTARAGASERALHFFFASSGAPAAWRSSRRPSLRSRVALFLARRDSYWSAMVFSRACGQRVA